MKRLHTDMAKLKGKIAEKSMTQEDVAAKIGINSSTFSRKMKSDGLSFTVGQIHRLVELLDITPQEAVQIFLQ